MSSFSLHEKKKKGKQTHFTQASNYTKGYEFITEQMPVVAIIRETFNPPLRHVAETNTHNSVIASRQRYKRGYKIRAMRRKTRGLKTRALDSIKS